MAEPIPPFLRQIALDQIAREKEMVAEMRRNATEAAKNLYGNCSLDDLINDFEQSWKRQEALLAGPHAATSTGGQECPTCPSVLIDGVCAACCPPPADGDDRG